MPAQNFTNAEEQVLRQAAVDLAAQVGFVAARQNMTKAEQKTFDAAAIQAKLNQIQLAIDNIDSVYIQKKANELNYLNSQKDFLTTLKDKVINTPE